MLVQITKQVLDFERVKGSSYRDPPVAEVHLEPHQQIVSCKWSTRGIVGDRKTVDWTAEVTIATYLEGTE
jgi:hypothetical protein